MNILFQIILQGNRPYWIQAIEKGKGVRGQTVFTTVGKPKMAQKQYNSPMEMYSEDALEEIRTEGTLGLVTIYYVLDQVYLLCFCNF